MHDPVCRDEKCHGGSGEPSTAADTLLPLPRAGLVVGLRSSQWMQPQGLEQSK